MTPFSIIIGCILIYIFFKNKKFINAFIDLLALYIFVYMAVEVGYIIKIVSQTNEQYIRYSMVLELIVFILALLMLVSYKFKIEQVALMRYLCPLLAVGVGVFDLIINPLNKAIVTYNILPDHYWVGKTGLQFPHFDSNVIKSFFQLFVFIFVFYIMNIYFQQEHYKRLLIKFCGYCKFLIVIGYFEFFTKNILGSNIFVTIINFVFGYNKNVASVMEQRGDFYRLCGLSSEASHFAYVLFIVCLAFLIAYKLKILKWYWLASCFILMIFTMSFSSVLFVFAFILIYLIAKNKKIIRLNSKLIRIIIGGFLLCIACVFVTSSEWFSATYFGQRLNEILYDEVLFFNFQDVHGLQYTSSRVRIISSIDSLKLVKYRPLFGLGIGVSSSHGSFSMILSELGIVGTLTWLAVLYFPTNKVVKQVYIPAYILMISIWCLTGILNSHFLGMLYNAENYILFAAFYFLSKRDASLEIDDNLEHSV